MLIWALGVESLLVASLYVLNGPPVLRLICDEVRVKPPALSICYDIFCVPVVEFLVVFDPESVSYLHMSFNFYKFTGFFSVSSTNKWDMPRYQTKFLGIPPNIRLLFFKCMLWMFFTCFEDVCFLEESLSVFS